MLRVAIVGGGPSGLFVFKRLVESGRADVSVVIFERGGHLGQGMPYSPEGAGWEHITNVSGSELPELVVPLAVWVRDLPQEKLDRHGLRRESFTQDKVLPRLLFGEYLEVQFGALRVRAAAQGMETTVQFDSLVTDLRDVPEQQQVEVVIESGAALAFDRVVICTGHHWPRQREGKVPGYFDSPYPPAKLARPFDHAVALRGSSLTAVDAVRTLARHNGRFHSTDGPGLRFEKESPNFRIVMHTRNGLLPCVRFHLEDPQVTRVDLLTAQDIESIRERNQGFVPLDLVFDEYFKKLLAERDPELHEKVRNLSLEDFVAAAMDPRERSHPFDFFAAEYRESLRSLAQRESIPWKETLAILSYALNYPAKYFCAEDMLRLRQVLAPLISIVIAFIPQSSSQELLALHAAGCLQLVSVGEDSEVKVEEQKIAYRYDQQDHPFETFVDCVGQPHLPLEAFPFKSLIDQKVVRQARLTFRDPQQARGRDDVERDEDGSYHLIVPGIAINDAFQPLDWQRRAHPRVQIMAVPYIGGHNPDYSGLDFCQEASRRIVEELLK
ncbi:MAG: FAD/NAD(P)-binding protein [Candidatus Eremiobacteraeota bacterium]|nr:FAD/NAD(P)-binding protein [Candidatus Eremiobacteraeota bacterium]MCW5871584.1 FAD/NAD(P)-binding protein [Candidatus Eremiobacteraeota bacterium]